MNESFVMRKNARPGSKTGRLLHELASDFAEHVAFFQAFLREPASVGALSPSSKALAQAMIKGLALERAEMVVELGPGTGAFTGPILERLGRRTTFISMELDPHYVRNLRRRFPDLVVYNDSAERLMDYLSLHGKKPANYIVSGLPWANIPVEAQSRVLDAILAALTSDGVFTTFAYFHACWLPKARQFRKSLEHRFAHVEISPVVWRNLPPAFVYRCRHAVKARKSPRWLN